MALSAAPSKVYTAAVVPLSLTPWSWTRPRSTGLCARSPPAVAAWSVCGSGPGRRPFGDQVGLQLKACGHRRRCWRSASGDLCRKRLQICDGRRVRLRLRLSCSRVRPSRCACQASPKRTGRKESRCAGCCDRGSDEHVAQRAGMPNALHCMCTCEGRCLCCRGCRLLHRRVG